MDIKNVLNVTIILILALMVSVQYVDAVKGSMEMNNIQDSTDVIVNVISRLGEQSEVCLFDKADKSIIEIDKDLMDIIKQYYLKKVM